MGANKKSAFACIMENMVYMVYVEIMWTPVKGGLLGKSQGGHYFIYKNLDLETGSNRWFGNYIKFGEQESDNFQWMRQPRRCAGIVRKTRTK